MFVWFLEYGNIYESEFHVFYFLFHASIQTHTYSVEIEKQLELIKWIIERMNRPTDICYNFNIPVIIKGIEGTQNSSG